MAHDAPIRASPRGDIRHDKIRRAAAPAAGRESRPPDWSPFAVG